MTKNTIDISMWQGQPDFDQIKASGLVDRVVIKAVDGASEVDPQFIRNWHEAKRVGLARTAYGFMEPGVDATAQANHLWAVVSSAGYGDGPKDEDGFGDEFWIDAELKGLTVAEVAQYANALQAHSLPPNAINIYSGESFIASNLDNGVGLGEWPLAIAAYQSSKPICPAGWTSIRYWQRTDSGQIPGIEGLVDLDMDYTVPNVLPTMHLTKPVVAIESTPSGLGYWLVAGDGGVFTFGDAAFHGSTGHIALNAPVVGVAKAPNGQGYWLAAADGGVFTFGLTRFYGSAGATKLNAPIVGMAATPTGQGYWLVAADGGIFSYGDAAFHGSAGATKLNAPIVGMAATSDGGGYLLAAADGGVFAFGNAQFHGSAGALKLAKPVVGIALTPSNGGYWLAASDGGVFSYGDAVFHGSMGAVKLAAPVVGVQGDGKGGYWLVAADGGVFSFGAAFKGSL